MLGLKRAVVGSYEEGKAQPKLETLRLICQLFDCTLDELVEQNLDGHTPHPAHASGKSLRVLSVTVDSLGKENIAVVPIKAVSGYLSGYADPQFVGQLPQFALPLPEIAAHRSYRIFQIKGHSMTPVQQGDYILAEYVANWMEIHDYQTYVVLTKTDGVVYKRVINKLKGEQMLFMLSDNGEYEPYPLLVTDILEVWKSVGHLAFRLPGTADQGRVDQLEKVLEMMRQEIDLIKGRQGR